MKILGIDTATKFLSIGLYDGAKIYEYNLEVGVRLSSILSITIKRLLEALDWQIADIDYFACGLGPGSFTGIRVGIATIKGLSYALRKPILGISTLDILAKGVLQNNIDIVPVIDAKRELIYCAAFKNKNGALKKITPYLLLSKDKFFKKIKPKSIVFGDAVFFYRDEILKNVKGVTILDKDYWYPKGHNIIREALGRIKDKKFNNAFNIKPIYLYPKECQIRK